MTDIELWGGHECTVNRIGDTFTDQTILSGHEHRASDLDAFAGLGLRALRYPLLWERVAPRAPDQQDWSWCDERTRRARALGLKVIAGLVHHGSGPAYVNLLSTDFATGLARHARAAAERYPWIEDWTPVNEPLTTARFSALYGHWYPHRRDETAFWLALLNQIDAIRLSMREIRAVTPHARLVQTEDLGRTYATLPLAEQARFDNLRRWMTWDLLTGKVGPAHGLWRRLKQFGFENRLRAIADDPCAPDVIGVNHYLTSDRYLDHRPGRFPHAPIGGNGRSAYVDVEAVRAASSPGGLERALREAWRRYGRTIAITEVHNACTRDEQVRWFEEAWRTARTLRREGVDVAAVTAWSLLGAFDWDSLLTRNAGHYECGVFDVSSGAPRPTALAHYLRRLAEDPEVSSGIEGRGWWRRDIRYFESLRRTQARTPHRSRRKLHRPLLITGATGTLGQALARACRHRELDYVLTSRRDLSLCNDRSIERAIARIKPRAVINAAGFVRVDDAEREQAACRSANADGAIQLAKACAQYAIPMATFSTDLVFDGALERRYLEHDAVNPLNIYGASKAEAERAIAELEAGALIIRTSSFFSPHDPHNFAAWVIRELSAGRDVHCAADVVMSPTYVPALANAVLDLVQDGEVGIWHLANDAALSWADFARMIARAMDLDASRVRELPCEELGWIAARPRNSALDSARGRLLRGLDEALWEFARQAGATTEPLARAA